MGTAKTRWGGGKMVGWGTEAGIPDRGWVGFQIEDWVSDRGWDTRHRKGSRHGMMEYQTGNDGVPGRGGGNNINESPK